MPEKLRPHVVLFCQVHLQVYGIEQWILGVIRELGSDYRFSILAKLSPAFIDLAAPYGVHLEEYPLLPSLRPAAIRRVINDFKRLDADLINAIDPRASIIGAPAARWLGLPIIVDRHVSPLQYHHSWVKHLAFFLGETFIGRFMSDVMPFDSENMRQRYVKSRILAASRSLHLPIGYNANTIRIERTPREEIRARFAIPSDCTLFTHIGRFSMEKAQDLIVQAAAQVQTTLNWHLILAGGGDLMPAIERQIHTLGLTNRVTLTGMLPHPTTLDLMAAADCLLLPSRFENAPVSLMEALALGTPSIVTPVGDSWRMIGEGSLAPAGLCVAVDDRNQLVAAMTRMIEDATLRSALAHACADRAPFYSQQHSLSQLDHCYRQLLARK